MDVALIVQTITEYLDLKSLLEVRLLNNLWNENAKLNIKKHYISLNTDEKICKMMDLWTNSFPLQKFEIFGDLGNLKNLTRKFGKSIKAYRFNGRKGEKFPSVEMTEALVIDIIQNSPNLQTLGFYNGFIPYIFVAPEVNCFLSKLNSFTFEYSRVEVSFQDTKLLKTILDASPSLQYLKLKNFRLELSSLIAVVANRNIKTVHLKRIHENSFQDNSAFNGNFSLELASVSVTTLSSHITKLNEFLQKYSNTIRYLKINGNSLQSVQIPTMQNLETLKLGEFNDVDIFRIPFYMGQFPSLNRLRLRLDNSQKRLNFLMKSNLPFQNLNHLELLFSSDRVEVEDVDDLPASIELPCDLPLLKLLRVKSNYCVTNINFPKNVSLCKLIMFNGFEFERIHLQFPNLKVLHIIIYDQNFGSKAEDLCNVFNNLPGLHELTLDLKYYSPGTLWKILSGLAHGDKDFMKEVINMMRSNMISLTQELLSESKPNLGNLNALRSLTVQGGDHMDASLAIVFLVFCGKLKNLTKLEISLLESSQRYFELFFGDILSSNNTRYQFLRGAENLFSKYHYDNFRGNMD